MNAFDGRVGAHFQRALMVGSWLLVALLAVGVVYVLSSLRYIGSGIAATNTITVSGTGQAYATPDTAEFSFSVMAAAPTVAAAQASATQKINALTQYLTGQGIAASDIQTTDYSIDPQYKYENSVCPQAVPAVSGAVGGVAIGCPPQGNQVLTGYQVTQSTQVKVTDTSKAGDLLAGVGSKGATNVSGLQFTVADPTAVQTDARSKAIADAKQKAQALASELGVSLMRVTGFQENQGGVVEPMAFATASGADTKAAVAPEISTGQNKVTDDVTVTYEIR